MTLAYSPYIVPLAIAALIAVALGIVIWRRRPGTGVIPFVTMMIGITIWSIFSALENAAVGLDNKLLMSSLVYLGITMAPGSWIAFSLEYTGRGRWLTRRNVALLAIEPVLTVIAIFTNQSHFLFHSPSVLDTSGAYPALSSTFGPLFWAHAVYSYILMIIGTGLLIRAFIKSPELYRGQIVGLLIGSFTPWLANAIFIFGFSPFPNLDLTPFAFTVTGVSMAWSIYRYRLLDIVPIARDMVVDGIDDAVIVLDARNRIVDINPAGLKLVGQIPRSAVVGKPIAELLAQRPDLVEEFRDVPSARKEIGIEVKGEQRAFELRLSPLRNAQGDLIGRLALLSDVTESKKAARQIQEQNETLLATNRDLSTAREKAEEANQIKSEFLANMSHELRTPLNSVIGYADLMLEGMSASLSPQQSDYLKRILSNGERLLTLINEVLDLSKIEAGRFELISVPMSPVDLLLRVEEQMRPMFSTKGLQFSLQIDPEMLSMKLLGDPGRLEQVLANLMSNAIKFTETGSVTVSVKTIKNARWQVTVKDTGIGIPPHARDLIFEAFRQVDGSSQRKHEGSGLGLAIAQRIVKLMGGAITVESEVGSGSAFTVDLPLLRPVYKSQAETPQP